MGCLTLSISRMTKVENCSRLAASYESLKALWMSSTASEMLKAGQETLPSSGAPFRVEMTCNGWGDGVEKREQGQCYT